MNIIKRDGSEVVFEKQKIAVAITKANSSVVPSARLTEEQIANIADDVESAAAHMNRALSVEEIQAIKHAKADPIIAVENGQIIWEIVVEGQSHAPAIGKHYAADELFCTIITQWGELLPVATGLGGRVVEICAKQGDHVNRGEIIAYLQRDELFK